MCMRNQRPAELRTSHSRGLPDCITSAIRRSTSDTSTLNLMSSMGRPASEGMRLTSDLVLLDHRLEVLLRRRELLAEPASLAREIALGELRGAGSGPSRIVEDHEKVAIARLTVCQERNHLDGDGEILVSPDDLHGFVA